MFEVMFWAQRCKLFKEMADVIETERHFVFSRGEMR
jgi:hypothetical protein